MHGKTHGWRRLTFRVATRFFPPVLGFIAIVAPSTALCWGNNLTHPAMAAAAVELSGDAEMARYCWALAHPGEGVPSPQCAWIDEGAAKQDLGHSPESLLDPFPYWIGPLIPANPLWLAYEAVVVAVGPSWNVNLWGRDSCGVDRFTWISHGYNPVTGDTWAFDELYGLLLGNFDDYHEDAIDRAEALWARAYDLYVNGDRSSAYFTLGGVCHLVQDLTVPAHVHVDVHPFGDDAERWAEGLFEVDVTDLEAFTPTDDPVMSDGDLVQGDTVRGILQDLAEFTYDVSAFQGNLIASSTPQPESELSAMFPSLHYQDGGILGGGYWYIDDVGPYNPIGFPGTNEWWPCEQDHAADRTGPGGSKRISGNFYIRNAAGHSGSLTPAVFTKPGIYESENNDETLLGIYGDILFPASVEYGAGMLALFRRDVEEGNVPHYVEDYSSVPIWFLPIQGLLSFLALLWALLIFLASRTLWFVERIPSVIIHGVRQLLDFFTMAFSLKYRG